MDLLLLISILWVASEILLSKIMKSAESDQNYDKSSLKILWITIALSITLGIFLRKTGVVISVDQALTVYYTGILLICLGLTIRWIAILKLKKSFTVNVSVAEGQKIVKTGFYKYVRHPAYLGSLLSFLGLGIVFNNWITLLIIFIPILVAFLYRIRVEEKVLIQAFDEQYSDYIRTSWRLLPGVY